MRISEYSNGGKHGEYNSPRAGAKESIIMHDQLSETKQDLEIPYIECQFACNTFTTSFFEIKP